MSGSELPSWLLKSREWITCTFEGIGTKRQAYLDLLNERMAKKGFQRAEKIKSATLMTSLISKASDLIYKSPDVKFLVGIRALSKGEDLRVGFAKCDASLTRTFLGPFLGMAFSAPLGLLACFLSAYIMGGGSLPDVSKLHPLIALIPVGVFFLVFLGLFTLFFWLFVGKPLRIWIRQVKATLIKTAESMGGKRRTPFEKAAVDLYTVRPSRLYRVIMIALKLAVIILIIVFILLMLLFPKPWGT